MIEHSLDAENAILYLQPQSALEKDDFVQLAKTADPFIEKTGGLAGLIIETPSFPGWKSLGRAATSFQLGLSRGVQSEWTSAGEFRLRERRAALERVWSSGFSRLRPPQGRTPNLPVSFF